MNEKIVIIGAGPHAKVVVDVIKSENRYDIIGLVDKVEKSGFWGIDIIGDDNCLYDLYGRGIKKTVIGIGDNKIRKRLFQQAKEIGFDIINVVSDKAIISQYAQLGCGVVVMPGAIINADTFIGDGCIINTNCSVDHDNYIGEFSHIAPGATLAGSVNIGAGTFCGVGCRIIDGIKIGHNVVIGAGTVIINPIESNSTVVGVPAKYIKRKEDKNE